MLEDFTRIHFMVTNEYYGLPKPIIEDNSLVIMIQDGKVAFGKYHEPTKENPFPSFSHPTAKSDFDNNDLLEDMERVLRKLHPEYFLDTSSVILTCPLIIANKIVW